MADVPVPLTVLKCLILLHSGADGLVSSRVPWRGVGRAWPGLALLVTCFSLLSG